MTPEGVVIAVLDGLERLGIAHMLVGSHASNVYGQLRSSLDADIVVRLSADDIDRLIEVFSGEFVVDPEVMRRDLEAGAMVNLIHQSGVYKVDLVPLRKTPHAAQEFERRRRIEALGRAV